ncbi:SAF domain protein [compost metagenome]
MKRGLVLIAPIEKGMIITEDHIGFKRPLKGIPINMLNEVIGKKIAKDMAIDEALDYNCIEW